MKKINLLLEAFTIRPDGISVSLIGYKWFRELEKLTNTTLVCPYYYKPFLSKLKLKKNSKIVYIKFNEKFFHLLKGYFQSALSSFLAENHIYRNFTKAAKKQIKKLMKTNIYDIHHKVTLVDTNISYLSTLGIPSIIGPINCGMDWPKKFKNSIYSKREKDSKFTKYFKNFVRKKIQNRSSIIKNYNKILVATKITRKLFPEKYSNRIEYFCENGVDINNFKFQINRNKIINCLYVGRFVPFKAIDILITAFAKSFKKNKNLRLTIVGDGSEKKNLENLVEQLKIKRYVKFTGFILNVKTVEYYKNSDIFLFSSLRESGGGVILEAMSCGTVPIVVDYAGPSELVNKKTGIKIKPITREQLIVDFSDAILKLAKDFKLRHKLAMNGRKEVEENYDWQAKAKRMLKIYKEVLKEDNK